MAPFEYSEKRYFGALVKVVTTPLVLLFTKTGLTYSVGTEARNYQVGAALLQTNPKRIQKPIRY